MTGQIATLMARAGLPVTDADLIAIAHSDALHRPLVDALYAVPESRYVDPALVFRADPARAEWHVED